MSHHHSFAIDLNDCGLSSLLRHNYEEATGFFRDALSSIKEEIHDQEQHKIPPPPTETQVGDLQDEYINVDFYEPSQTDRSFRNLKWLQESLDMQDSNRNRPQQLQVRKPGGLCCGRDPHPCDHDSSLGATARIDR